MFSKTELSKMLQRRYVVNFIGEMKKIGCDRAHVESTAVDAVNHALKLGDIDSNLVPNMDEFVKESLKSHLDAVFGDSGTV